MSYCSPTCTGSVNPAGQGPEKRLGTRAVQSWLRLWLFVAVSLSLFLHLLNFISFQPVGNGLRPAEGGVPHLLWGTPRALGPRC